MRKRKIPIGVQAERQEELANINENGAKFGEQIVMPGEILHAEAGRVGVDR